MGRIPLELVLLMTCFCNAKGDICYSRAWGIAEEHLSTHVSDAAPECKCHGLAGKQPHLVKQGGKKKIIYFRCRAIGLKLSEAPACICGDLKKKRKALRCYRRGWIDFWGGNKDGGEGICADLCT